MSAGMSSANGRYTAALPPANGIQKMVRRARKEGLPNGNHTDSSRFELSICIIVPRNIPYRPASSKRYRGSHTHEFPANTKRRLYPVRDVLSKYDV